MQRQGYYWPSMQRDAGNLQLRCPKCTLLFPTEDCCCADTGEDWRQVYIDFLREGSLPPDRLEAAKVRRRSTRYFLEQDKLFRRTLDGTPLRCLAGSEVDTVMRTAHEVEHQGGSKLYAQLLHSGYYWPTMEKETAHYVKKCHACQKHGNLIHAPAVDLHSLRTPWPFHTWAMDLVGPIAPSRGYQWILAATELSTKWVEAICLKRAQGGAVSNFIRENIVCRFGPPKVIISDNGTPFINHHVRTTLEEYLIKHVKSTPYYPQGNGQAEATNKTLIRILSKMMDEQGGTWPEQLPTALWAYRISRRRATQATPYSLVYGSEVVVPTELALASARLALDAGMIPDSRRLDLEALDERRDTAARYMTRYQESLARAYNQSVIKREFKVGNLVWKTVEAVMKGQPLKKFAPKWEGPYEIIEENASGYYRLVRVEDGFHTSPINAKYIKPYYV